MNDVKKNLIYKLVVDGVRESKVKVVVRDFNDLYYRIN